MPERHSSRGPVASHALVLALAYLLVLQVLLAGLTSGLQAAPSPLGTAWVLCSAEAAPQAPGAPAPSGHADCCTLGCPMLGTAPPPAEQAALNRPRPESSAAALPRAGLAPPVLAERSPRSTRGPPRLA